MVEWGYQKYVRDHTIVVGWTEVYARNHMAEIEKYLQVRMANLCPVEYYFRHVLARQEHDTSARLKDIRVPTLILVGDEDRITPPSLSEELHRLIPGSELQLIAGAGHLSNAEQPQAFNSAIESFLSQ